MGIAGSREARGTRGTMGLSAPHRTAEVQRILQANAKAGKVGPAPWEWGWPPPLAEFVSSKVVLCHELPSLEALGETEIHGWGLPGGAGRDAVFGAPMCGSQPPKPEPSSLFAGPGGGQTTLPVLSSLHSGCSKLAAMVQGEFKGPQGPDSQVRTASPAHSCGSPSYPRSPSDIAWSTESPVLSGCTLALCNCHVT